MPNVVAAAGYNGRPYQKRQIGSKESEPPHLHGRQHEEYLTAHAARRFRLNDPLRNQRSSNNSAAGELRGTPWSFDKTHKFDIGG